MRTISTLLTLSWGAPELVYEADVTGVDPDDLEPGAVVSFTATDVVDFFGALEFVGATGVSVTGINPVHVIPSVGTGPLVLDDLRHHNIEVWGELLVGPTPCSGLDCWEYLYGDGIITLRANPGYLVGDCVHWIGPMNEFLGDEQLNADDFDWLRYY